MGFSLNGWPQPVPTDLAVGLIPGTSKRVTLQRDVLPLFLAYLADWHRTVMPIDVPGALGPDGYADRMARTGAGLSNHASGTAVDVRYDVLKADHLRHMNPMQIAAVHRLLDKYVLADGRRVLGWGGDWTVGQYCDEMHTELAQDWAPGAKGRAASKADVLEVIHRLGIRTDGTTAPAVPATPPVKPLVKPPYPGTFGGTLAVTTGVNRGPYVRATQRGLRVPETSVWDAVTQAAMVAWQRKRLIKATGVVGPMQYRLLAKPI